MILTQLSFHRKTTEGKVEKGGSRKGSPLEGESGLTPAGKTLPNPFPQNKAPEEGGHYIRLIRIATEDQGVLVWTIHIAPLLANMYKT